MARDFVAEGGKKFGRFLREIERWNYARGDAVTVL